MRHLAEDSQQTSVALLVIFVLYCRIFTVVYFSNNLYFANKALRCLNLRDIFDVVVRKLRDRPLSTSPFTVTRSLRILRHVTYRALHACYERLLVGLFMAVPNVGVIWRTMNKLNCMS